MQNNNRDHQGNWIHGFNQFIGHGDNLLSEMWGAALVLRMATSIGIEYLWMVESDCLNLINLLSNIVDNSHPLSPIISMCRSSISSFKGFRLTQVPRANVLKFWMMRKNCCCINTASHKHTWMMRRSSITSAPMHFT